MDSVFEVAQQGLSAINQDIKNWDESLYTLLHVETEPRTLSFAYNKALIDKECYESVVLTA